MLMRAFENRSTALARGLSLLLVAFILYGTTAEAAWARLPADSPNAAEPAPVLRVFLAGSRQRRTVRRLLAALAALGRERPAR